MWNEKWMKWVENCWPKRKTASKWHTVCFTEKVHGCFPFCGLVKYKIIRALINSCRRWCYYCCCCWWCCCCWCICLDGSAIGAAAALLCLYRWFWARNVFRMFLGLYRTIFSCTCRLILLLFIIVQCSVCCLFHVRLRLLIILYFCFFLFFVCFVVTLCIGSSAQYFSCIAKRYLRPYDCYIVAWL